MEDQPLGVTSLAVPASLNAMLKVILMKWTTIPIHPGKSIDPDLLGDISRQIKVTREEFLAALKKKRGKLKD